MSLSSAVWASRSSFVDSRSACDGRTTGCERRLSNPDASIITIPSRRTFSTFRRKSLRVVDRAVRLATSPMKLPLHRTLVECDPEMILACGQVRLLTERTCKSKSTVNVCKLKVGNRERPENRTNGGSDFDRSGFKISKKLVRKRNIQFSRFGPKPNNFWPDCLKSKHFSHFSYYSWVFGQKFMYKIQTKMFGFQTDAENQIFWNWAKS